MAGQFAQKEDFLKDKDIVAYQEKSLGVIVINRPRALNALTWEMIREIRATLEAWENDDTVKAVIFYGAGERSFCAGGDIKAVHQHSKEDAHAYFADEYGMNAQLYHYRKPLIAFMNGFTMGGGYGVAGFCDYRIVTERTRFAMPEVGIGFFPDIGSVYFLEKLEAYFGTFLAVTGAIIGANDTLRSGIGTHYMKTAVMDKFIKDLGLALRDFSDSYDAVPVIESMIARMKARIGKSDDDLIPAKQDIIGRCFAADTVEDIVENLAAEDSDWAQDQLTLIQSRSPLSVKIAFSHIRQAKDVEMDEILERDLKLSDFFMAGREFAEGVRALLVDKDKKPLWGFADLHDVDSDAVARLVRGELPPEDALGILDNNRG